MWRTLRAEQRPVLDEDSIKIVPEPDEQSGLQQQLTAWLQEPDEYCGLQSMVIVRIGPGPLFSIYSPVSVLSTCCTIKMLSPGEETKQILPWLRPAARSRAWNTWTRGRGRWRLPRRARRRCTWSPLICLSFTASLFVFTEYCDGHSGSDAVVFKAPTLLRDKLHSLLSVNERLNNTVLGNQRLKHSIFVPH